MKSIAIVQSNYVPWKGYFDLVNLVDEFVLLDEVQFTKRDWRNRNKIKTARGLVWLTIPVHVKGRYHQKIRETRVLSDGWSRKHLATLRHSYGRAPHFERYESLLVDLYGRAAELGFLSDVNRMFMQAVCDELGIKTRVRCSEEFEAPRDRVERLVDICRQAGATRYVSGPSARDYLDEDRFATGGIEVDYFDYDGYPEYQQLHPPFEHTVSILDLLLHTGCDAPRFMKTF